VVRDQIRRQAQILAQFAIALASFHQKVKNPQAVWICQGFQIDDQMIQVNRLRRIAEIFQHRLNYNPNKSRYKEGTHPNPMRGFQFLPAGFGSCTFYTPYGTSKEICWGADATGAGLATADAALAGTP